MKIVVIGGSGSSTICSPCGILAIRWTLRRRANASGRRGLVTVVPQRSGASGFLAAFALANSPVAPIARLLPFRARD